MTWAPRLLILKLSAVNWLINLARMLLLEHGLKWLKLLLVSFLYKFEKKMDATKIISPGTISDLLLNPDLRNKLKGTGGGGALKTPYNSTFVTEVPLCVAATTGDILLDGTVATVDGVTLVAGELVLVWQQTDTTANRVYIVNLSGAWLPFDPHSPGMLVSVRAGATYAESVFMLVSDDVGVGSVFTFEKVNDGEPLPTGTEGQTLRYNASNVLEANSVITNTDVAANIDVLRAGILVADNTSDAAIVLNVSDEGNDVEADIYSFIDATTGLIRTTSNTLQLRADKFIMSDRSAAVDNTGKYPKIKDSTGELEFVDISTGLLPAGTTNNSTLRYNSATGAFLETIRQLFLSETLYSSIYNRSPNTLYSFVAHATDSLSYFSVFNDLLSNITGTINSSTSNLQLRNGGNSKGITELNAYTTYSATNIILSSIYNSVYYLKILQDGKIYSNDLKAPASEKTILLSDDTGLIQKLTDGTANQFLTTDGAGNYAFGDLPIDIQKTLGFIALGAGVGIPYSNLFTGATSLADATGLDVTLEDGVYYELKLNLLLSEATSDGSDVDFEIKLAITGTVANSAPLLQTAQTIYEDDVIANTSNLMALDTAKSYTFLTGSTTGKRDMFAVTGLVYGGASGGTIQVQMRLTSTGKADGVQILTALGGSTLSVEKIAI